MNRPLLLARPTQVRYGVLAWFCTLSMITYIDRVCIMQVQDEMRHDLDLTPKEFAWAFSAFALAYAIFEVPTGWLGDRIGPRRVLTRIVICWLLFTALTGAVWGFVSLVVIRFLFGAGEAGAYPNIARGAKNWFPFSERGRAQGFIWTFGRLGGALAPVLIIALAAPFAHWEIIAGWRGSFLMLGGIGLLWVIGFNYWFRDTPQEHPSVNEAERALIEGPAYRPWGETAVESPDQKRLADESIVEAGALGVPRPADAAITAETPQPEEPAAEPVSVRPSMIPFPTISWADTLSSPTLWFLSFMYFCSNSGWSFFITYVMPYLKNDLGLEGWPLHLASGAPLFCGAIGCLCGGFLTDFLVPILGRRWGRTLQGTVAYALGGTFFLWAVLVTQENPVLAFVAICLASFVKDFAMGASWSTTIDIGHRYSGTVAGLMNTLGNMGTVISPPLVMAIVHRTGGGEGSKLSVSLFYYSAMFFIASLCWLFINPRRVIVYTPADRQRLQETGVLL
jgi:MFS transporter, ACS family, glucarate transporter